jgi:phytoene dehydrogenase-like protein
MLKTLYNGYDAVIIGAGIGGLVCGCYLAKAGLKVLIIEQHNKPGGYCTSFSRQEFNFDAGPHCFGSYRSGGITRKIFEELDIARRLKIIRSDPSDMLVTPDYTISFWNNFEKTIEELSSFFPRTRNLKEFFKLLLDTDPHSFSRMRSITFQSLLDQYHFDNKLKAILSMPLLAIHGLPPSLISAFVGAKLYSEFIIDGGYYPVGSMQMLPNALAQRFKEFQGELRLSTLVHRIMIKSNRAIGVVLDNGEFIPSNIVISNCDARQTFLQLLGEKNIDSEFCKTLLTMKPSLSNIILYLGLDKSFSLSGMKPGTFVFFFSHYDVEKAYRAVKRADFKGYGGHAFRISHDYSSVYAGMPAPYKSRSFWNNYKKEFLESFIEKLENYSIPGLKKYIRFKNVASPYTMHRYTLNYKGASYGWSGLPSQIIVPGLRRPSFLDSFYLVGHWTTLGVGVSGVAYVGYDTAKIILKKSRINKEFLIE